MLTFSSPWSFPQLHERHDPQRQLALQRYIRDLVSRNPHVATFHGSKRTVGAEAFVTCAKLMVLSVTDVIRDLETPRSTPSAQVRRPSQFPLMYGA